MANKDDYFIAKGTFGTVYKIPLKKDEDKEDEDK